MADIVTRLVAMHGLPRCTDAVNCVVCEAADEIERLRAAGDALASAFEEIPQWPEWFYKVYETWLKVRRG